MKSGFSKYYFLQHWMMLSLFIPFTSIAQHEDSSENVKLFAYPLGYYSPETRIGIGAAGAVNFRWNRNDSITPPSQITFGIGGSQNKQYTLSIPFSLYSTGRKHTLTGEFSLNDFNYRYYGIGEENDKEYHSSYVLHYTLIRFNYLYQFRKYLFGGFRWWYENDKINSFEIHPTFIDSFPGKNGGVSSGPGIVFQFDNRDNIYYTGKGYYLELVGQNQAAIWGSDFKFNRYRFDFRAFHPITKKLTIANNVFGDFTQGDVPFGQLALMGSGRRGRGFYQGRYRDKNLLLYQGELRKKLDDRVAVTAFWIYGLLSEEVNNFSLRNDHAAAGFGIRYFFDKRSGSTIRLDFAWPINEGVYLEDPDNALKVYFTVNESF